MADIPPASHRFSYLFEASDQRVLKVTLRGEDIFRLRCFFALDPSIYAIADQWCAHVVEPVSGRHPDFKRLFHSNSAVDFVESDITEIVDDVSGDILFRRDPAA